MNSLSPEVRNWTQLTLHPLSCRKCVSKARADESQCGNRIGMSCARKFLVRFSIASTQHSSVSATDATISHGKFFVGWNRIGMVGWRNLSRAASASSDGVAQKTEFKRSSRRK